MEFRKIKIFNGRIITPYRVINGGTVLLEGGRILAVTEDDIPVQGAIEIDARGQYISPGFIDIHVHGGGDSDFMDGDVQSFLTVAETHMRYGTTSMVPTTLSSDTASLLNAVKLYEQAHQRNTQGAAFLGIHLEGPYFAMNQRGAQDPRYIRNPDPEEYKAVLASTDAVVRWSAAPELPGSLEFGRYLRERKILPAAAHTDAIYEEMLEAFECGYTHATHLYSAMSGVTRRNAFRYAGAVESAFLMDEMTVEIIADGIHLPPPLLKLVYKIKGADKTALITDAMRAAGMPEGESILGARNNGLRVIVEDNVAKLPDRSSFAGSVATTDQLVRNMVKMADVPLADAVRMMSSTPAAIMKVADRKGSLTAGRDADVLIFDEDIRMHAVICGGRILHQAEHTRGYETVS
ncbi:N-acetylglucosamine-6-phosphate deacetylase [Chitinophaga sp. GCM10012297]|uniref:N-acetylglucosamine-6-phosphate deacetylase n=1 Tax=Chitinophaga chungangae TaxID=2821488 RepID=A0ABS3YHL2_9BACT|nr:N-acetylglucosamine-6-phosphate deacetylase [Chitinophaga chungangae]MBO9154162.1 N-acetylglucosamine-6-phosphate deacetylase [Chitinophaga chungangae]